MDFDKKVKDVLESLGLTEIQSRFYLALLKRGGTAVSKVAKDLEINRTNSYNIVQKLKDLDLVWEENHVAGKVIHAKSYEQILSALDTQSKKINTYKDSIEKLIPIFTTFESDRASFAPKIKTFEGKSAITNMTEDILNSAKQSKEIYLLTNQQSERGFFTASKRQKFINTRVEKKIFIKVLAVDNKEGRDLIKEDKKLLRETKILPQSFNFHSEIYIYDGKVSMVDLKGDIIGVIIESEELFQVHRSLFESLWSSD